MNMYMYNYFDRLFEVTFACVATQNPADVEFIRIVVGIIFFYVFALAVVNYKK